MIQVAQTGRAKLAWLSTVLAAAIAPFVFLAAYAYPTADDFDYAMDTRLEGYWPAFSHQYTGWNGRFASNVLVLANPMVNGSTTIYRVVAAAMFVVTIAAIYVFARAIAGSAFDRRLAVGCALAWCGAYLAGVPALGENFYWYTGAVTYQLSSVLLLAQVALFVHALRRRTSFDTFTVVALASVLVVFAVGMNEIAMLLAVAFYGAFIVFAALRGDRRAALAALICFAAALAAGLAVWLAPGNAVRAALYPTKHDLVRSVAMTAMQTVRFGATWATAGTLLLATMLFAPLAERIAATERFWRELPRREFIALLVAPFAAIPLGVFPAFWATGLLGQHRTVSVAYAAFMALWFVATLAVAGRGLIPASALTAPSPFRPALACALAVSIAFTGNGYTVMTDLMTGRARRFAEAMDGRSAMLAVCRQAGTRPCLIPRLPDPPRVIFVSDAAADAEWTVQSHARYLGVSHVELAPTPDNVRH
jgi:hypothetical protein